ncbi:MAG: DUF192 domain-containing protein [Proteobacteria bacterium]|jgi:uncharacterized membrane protein (UPF0127 family)|nr:DUF192 domain-containing protein [Pseudomonadota bacterium]
MFKYQIQKIKYLLGVFLILYSFESLADIDGSNLKNIVCKMHVKNNKNITLSLDIADTKEKKSIGLMHRNKIKNNHGMLFLWPDSQTRIFWMHNTFINLDLFFMNQEGVIIEIYRNAIALDKFNIQSKVKARSVLELNAGEFKGNLGDKLVCPSL